MHSIYLRGKFQRYTVEQREGSEPRFLRHKLCGRSLCSQPRPRPEENTRWTRVKALDNAEGV